MRMSLRGAAQTPADPREFPSQRGLHRRSSDWSILHVKFKHGSFESVSQGDQLTLSEGEVM